MTTVNAVNTESRKPSKPVITKANGAAKPKVKTKKAAPKAKAPKENKGREGSTFAAVLQYVCSHPNADSDAVLAAATKAGHKVREAHVRGVHSLVHRVLAAIKAAR